MRRLWVVVAIMVVAAGAAIGIVLAAGGTKAPRGGVVTLSRPMPSLSGRTLAGGTIVPRAYRGHPLVVIFWNEFCPPCRAEQRELNLAYGRLHSRGVAFVGVHYVGGNWPNDPPAARRYLDVFGVRYPSLPDPFTRIAGDFGIRGIPTTVVVDAGGVMRFMVLGKVRPGQLDRLVNRLPRS